MRLQLQRICRYERAVGENYGALNGVLQFADVARPAVVENALLRAVGELRAGFAEFARELFEEVVGEIADETDPAGGAVRRLANGDWYVRGHVPITDLADYGLDLPVDSDAYNSVGGFVFGELGRLPKRGDMVNSNGYSLRVESVRENRIEAVRIRDHEPTRREAEQNGGSVRDEG